MRPHRSLRWAFAAAVIIIVAPARERAHAQFAPPYDPDFAQKKQAAEAVVSEEEAGPAVILGAGDFLLRDRPAKEHIFEVPPEEPAPTPEFLQFEQSLRPFQYSQARWNKTREDAERGVIPTEGSMREYVVKAGEIEISTSLPNPPPPEVELPAYGTSLSITGRKVISFNFSEKRYIHPQLTTARPQTTGLFDIQQQLQLRMQGKVGPKITVNVDYDDTKANKQDISVVYQGDPNEIVQNVSFGDIDLSLPASEFVSYNKQLFGIRADIKYKGVKATFIGSRTKGVTKIKTFTGNTQFNGLDILDIGYVRRTYYDLSFGDPARLPIRLGSERVFLAQQIPNQSNTNLQTITADDLAVPSSTFTGTFQQLFAGQDYTIDYTKGIITFRNQLQPQFVVAVDFIDNTGHHITNESTTTFLAGTGNIKLIKTPADLPIAISSETGYRRELKTFYNIGQTQIVRDDGRGNFNLRVLDPATRNEIGSALVPVQKYPNTINVDFENGLFQLQQPFSLSNDSPTIPDPDIYSPTPITKRLFRVEFNYRFKTFFLEPNLVAQSEVVILDNVKLVRNVDYFIDYEAGFITFFNEDRIHSDSSISIAFEVAPFLGISNESLLGTRVAYDINPHASVGSTLLYQAGTRSPTVPAVTELARSLITYEVDSQLKSIKLLSKLTMNMAGEFAQSHQNLNLNGFAIVDNMEGIKQEDATSILAAAWRIAANPGGVPSDPTKLNWINEDVKILDINPRANATTQETQKVLDFQYDFSNPASQEESIVFPFSISGVDFSQKTLLEVVMTGDNSNNEINFHLGGINEDADGSGLLKTEDLNLDGLLSPAEDVGWCYTYNGNPCAAHFGAVNGALDSEDLNKNGRLDPADFTGDDFGYLGSAAAGNNQLPDITNSVNHTQIDFGGNQWRTFQIPLNISSVTANTWTAIKQVRVSVRKKAGGAVTGVLKFARIAVVGNTWQRGQAGDPASGLAPLGNESMIATPINNVDNPTYTPIFNAGGQASQVFNDLYGSVNALQKQSGTNNISEQALEMEFFNLKAGATVITKRVFSRAVDISQHKFFNFLVFGNADANNLNTTGNKVFFLRAGDDQNFFEVQVPITFSGWKKIVVEQVDTSGGTVPNIWKANTAGTVVISSGAPSLAQVSELVAGVRSLADGTQPLRGRLYLNEIHLSQPILRVGIADKLEVTFDSPGWATFGGKHRAVDRNFQTPTSVISNQDNTADSGYANFIRLPFFPMNFNLARSVTDTPSTVQTGNLSNTVNLLQQGKVTTWNGTAAGNFNYGSLPRVGLSYLRNRTEYSLLTRLDDRQSYGATLSYGVPKNFPLLPKTVDANYGLIRHLVNFDAIQALQLPGNFKTDEKTQNYGMRMSFVPWFGSAFNPNYTASKVSEKRADFTSGPELDSAYPKSLNQTIGFGSNFRVVSWLNPQVSYSITTIENNVLSTSTFFINGATTTFDVGQIKTINRNANGSVNLPVSIAEIFPKTRLFHSMNIAAGYQVQDGDVWNNVEDQLRSETKLWIRSPLRPQNPAAIRSNLTLRDTYNSTQRWSPVEAYPIRGRLAPLKTLSISNNYVQSIQRSEVTGTASKTITTTLPDAVASISQLEQLWYLERWLANTQMNFKFTKHNTLNVGLNTSQDASFGTDLRTIIVKKFDTLLNYNNRTSSTFDLVLGQVTQQTSHEDGTAQVTFDYKKFRFTPKIDYSADRANSGTGVITQNLTVITPSVLVRADLALPRGLRLPGSTKTLLFTNRVIWTTTTSLAIRRSPITVADNSKLFSLTTSADYEIAKNLRMSLNGAASRLWHTFLKEEEFLSYQLGSTLTFQF